jgi:arylsulfatase A-like enzyme
MPSRSTAWNRVASLLALLALALPLLTGLHTPPARAQSIRKPNVILIVADDLDARLLARLPKIDAFLGDGGTSFPNFFVTIPQCCPSRATILRGQYVHNHRVYTNNGRLGGWRRWHGLGLGRSTIATWLNDSGYRTGIFGKFLNGYEEDGGKTVDPGWDNWTVLASGSYFDYTLNVNGKEVAYGNGPKDYLTDVLSDRLDDFVRDSVRNDVPFFAYVPVKAPHAPATPAPRHANAHGNVKAPRVPSWNEDDVSDKPPSIRDLPRLSRDDIRRINASYRKRLRSMLAVDDLVGRLSRTLSDLGVADSTYIFVTSDNGYQLGEHRIRCCKGRPYEESIRVSLLARGPGIGAGATDRRLVATTDLAPTIAEIAGATPDRQVDGRSFLPLLRGENVPWRTAVLIEQYKKGDNPKWLAVRVEDGVYIEHDPSVRERYDLAADPYQLENLAGADPELDAALAARVDALRSCSGDTCRTAEDAPPHGAVTAASRDGERNRDGGRRDRRRN